MRLVRFILPLLLLISVSTRAAIEVQSRVRIADSTTWLDEDWQGIPRKHIYGKGTNLWIIRNGAGGLRHEMLMMSNYGQTFADSINLSNNIGNHLHFTERGDTAYIFGNNYGGLTLKRLFRVNVATRQLIDSVDIDSAGYDDDLGSIAFCGGNNMVALNRGPDELNNSFYMSGDRSASWALQGDMFPFNIDDRIGMAEKGDTAVAFVYVRGSSPRRYEVWRYDGTQFLTPDTIQTGTTLERLFCFGIGPDGYIHVITMDTANPSNIYHIYQDPSGTWSSPTIIYTAGARITSTGGLWTACSYSEYDRKFRVFYTKATGSVPDQLWVKTWDNSTNAFVDSLQVDAATTIRNLAGSRPLPAEMESRAAVLYIKNDGTRNYPYLAVVHDPAAPEWSPRPTPPDTGWVDLLDIDYSGEDDSLLIGIKIDPNYVGGDSVLVCLSTSIPDSTQTDSVWLPWPTTSPWLTFRMAHTFVEDDWAYISAWAYDADADTAWSERYVDSLLVVDHYIVIKDNETFPITVNQAFGDFYHSQGNGATTYDTIVIAGTRIETGGSLITFATNTHHFMIWGGANGGKDTLIGGIDSTQQGPNVIAIQQRTAQGTAGGNRFEFRDLCTYITPNHYSTVFWYQDSMYMPWQLDTSFCTPDQVVVWDSAFQANDVNEQDRATAINLGYKNYDIDIINVDAYITGYCYNANTGHAIAGGWWGIKVCSSLVWNNIQAYESRGPYCAMCVSVASAPLDTLIAEGVTALTSFDNKYLAHGWSGVMGRPYSSIIRDTFEIDCGNARWLSGSGGAEGGHANAHCVFTYGPVPGLEIAYCTMTSGSLKKGGRAIEMEDADGTAVAPWHIHHNFMDMHEGPDTYFGASYQPSGSKVRNGSEWGLFEYNIVILTGNTDHNDSDVSPWNNSYHNNGHAFIYQQETFGTCTGTSEYNLTFQYNTFVRRDRGSSGNALMQAVEFDKCVCDDPTTLWQFNTIITDTLAYRFGQYDGEADSVRIRGDSVVFVDTVYGHALAAVGYLASYSGDDIRFFDLKYCIDNGTALTCATCEDEQSDLYFSTAYDDDVAFYYTIMVQVLDAGENPVEGARVRVRDGYGVEREVDSTNANGVDSISVKVARYFRTSTDSTGFNDFEIHAILGADSVTMDTCTVTCNNKTFTLTLSAPLPCAASQTSDTTGVTFEGFTAIDIYSYDTDSTLQSLTLLWDDDGDPASPLGSPQKTSNFGSPDSLPVTGLDPETDYWFWWILQNGTCAPDTSAPFALTTPAEPIPGSFDDAGWTLQYEETFDSEFEGANNMNFGTDNWLTMRLTGGTSGISVAGGYAQVNSPQFSDVALIRTTDTLPSEYKMRLKIGHINYDLSNYEQADIEDPNFDSHEGLLENGCYWLTIAEDTCYQTECAEAWWHLNRKLVIDVDNHLESLSPDVEIVHPLYMVSLGQNVHSGMNWLQCWDTTGTGTWDYSEWNWLVAYTYALSTWYYAEIERSDGYYTLRFYDGLKNLIEETTPIAASTLDGYGAPDWGFTGEPHSDDYEGDCRVDEIQLFVPEQSQGQAARRIRIIRGDD